MLNVKNYDLCCISVSTFLNPKQNNAEYIVANFVDVSKPINERSVITLIDKYDKAVYSTFLTDMLGASNAFPIVTVEGVIYGYGRKLNLAKYNGFVFKES